MTVYLLFIFAISVVLGIGKIFLLAVAPKKVDDRGYVAFTSIWWLMIAAWTAYWVLHV